MSMIYFLPFTFYFPSEDLPILISIEKKADTKGRETATPLGGIGHCCQRRVRLRRELYGFLMLCLTLVTDYISFCLIQLMGISDQTRFNNTHTHPWNNHLYTIDITTKE